MTAERELQVRSMYDKMESSLLCFRDIPGSCPDAEVRESKFSDVILIQNG